MGNDLPLISICLITYNHAPFIKDAIDSILSQELGWTIEIVIGDDGSTDGTSEICSRYASKYPNLIRHFVRDRKDVIYVDGRPTGNANIINTLNACQGKYIALLEGDDYWVNPSKLKLQLEFLEQNEQLSGVFHETYINSVPKENQDFFAERIEDIKQIEVTLAQLLASGSMAPTASLFFRKKAIIPLPLWYRTNPSDWKIEIMLGLSGNLVKFVEQYWSVYRVHDSGVWSSLDLDRKLRFRKTQLKDLSQVEHLRFYKKELDVYLTQTYKIAYEGFAKSSKVKSIYFLLLFIKVSDLSTAVKVKHLFKTAFRIIFNL